MIRATLVAAALAFTACESSPPCTQCPSVGGLYEVTFSAVDAEQSTCKEVFFTGGTGQVTLVQDGSALSFVDDVFPLEGTLLENNTATMQTRSPIVSDTGLRLSANGVLTFAGGEGAFTFSGDLNLNVETPQCQLTVPVQAKQLAAQ